MVSSNPNHPENVPDPSSFLLGQQLTPEQEKAHERNQSKLALIRNVRSLSLQLYAESMGEMEPEQCFEAASVYYRWTLDRSEHINNTIDDMFNVFLDQNPELKPAEAEPPVKGFKEETEE